MNKTEEEIMREIAIKHDHDTLIQYRFMVVTRRGYLNQAKGHILSAMTTYWDYMPKEIHDEYKQVLRILDELLEK